ncbi:hypothetical protein BHE90_005831 [Fusarium euwallaceae]|uniref:Uncharacterized protein n=1 Tax=Fusarium euwallaceae TaxID=1147111 RepID=A0A430LVB8_9HYPO|nr:hypothetical protein BHE90_005831 [Fusarium euwallaceae]
MPPNPEGERRRENDEAQNPRNPPNRPAFRAYFERIERWKTATLEWVSEPDEWKKRLTKTIKISPKVENKPFLEVLGGNGIESDAIPCFIQPSRSSARWSRRVSRIERFCEGGTYVLQDAIPGGPEISEFSGTPEPEAWVSDRNWVEEGFVGDHPNYPRILDNKTLHLVLLKKRFPEDSQGDAVGPPRRIYIKNPNGASVVAMIKTTPVSQVEGFRHLFADYITVTPEPKFMLRMSTWWGGCFVISFNVPYYGISTQELQDCRDISNDGSNDGQRLRNRYNLDFLHLKDYETSNYERSSFHDHAILHEAVYSLTVTGKSDKYWTAACLDDHVFDEESNLESDEETLELDGKSDPIIHQAVLEAEGDLTKSPRSYAIAALKMALDKIVEHHVNILDWFKASFSLHTSEAQSKIPTKEMNTWLEKFPRTLSHVTYSTANMVTKLDYFLTEDVIFSRDGLPQGVLWQSLQYDPNALQSLLEIQQHRNQLRDIAGELRQLTLACKEVRRQRQTDNEGEQQIITGRVYRAAIAAFGFAILNTVAQLYSAKPSNDEPGSWPSYVAMVVFCILMGVVIAVYLFWQQVRQWFGRLVAFLPERPRALPDRP